MENFFFPPSCGSMHKCMFCLFTPGFRLLDCRKAIEKMEAEERERIAKRQERIDSVMKVMTLP